MLIMMVGLSLFFTSSIQEDLALLARAEAAFAQGREKRDEPEEAQKHFRAAADDFETLHRDGIRSHELYHNLGNAYLLSGNLPRAILTYRQALQPAPGDAETMRHLTYARSQVDYPENSALGHPPTNLWMRAAARYLYLTCFGLAIVLYSISCAVVTRWMMTRKAQQILIAVTALTGALLTTSLAAVGFMYEHSENRQDHEHPVVVIANDGTLLRKGNGFTYPPRYETALNRGVEARLVLTKGNWVQIELSGGEVGWVPRSHIEE